MSSLLLGYDEVFDSFLQSVTDYNLASMEPGDAYRLMAGWLKKAVARPYIRRLFSELRMDGDSQELSFSLRHPMEGESDDDQADFVQMVLSQAMVVEWCEPQVKKTTNIAQMFAGKEQKFYSQAPHIQQLRELLSDTKADLRQELGDRGVLCNSYLGNVL